jgi:hypothetical protein
MLMAKGIVGVVEKALSEGSQAADMLFIPNMIFGP